MTDEKTMGGDAEVFDLETFLPFLLNQAAEAASRAFQQVYRSTYGMTRTQWRVMANLGRFGPMTATRICRLSQIEKTKASRAIAALEAAGMLGRAPSQEDRRAEILTLTAAGRSCFAELGRRAIEYDRAVRERLGGETADVLSAALRVMIAGGPRAPGDAED